MADAQQQWSDFIASKGYSGADARKNMGQYVDEFNKATGNSWQAGTANASGLTDTLRTSASDPWTDVIHGGDDKWQWYNEPAGGAASSGGGGGAAGGSSFAPASVFQVGSSMTSNWTPDPRSDSLYNALMARSQQSLLVNPNDPVIRNQVDAFGAGRERANRNNLRQVAESAGPNANTSAETRSGAEKVGQDTGNFEGALMGRELTARRDEIQNALTEMGSILSDQQRLALQQELAKMDNAMQQATLAQQGSQFNANLGQGAYQFDVNDEFRRSPLA